MDIKYLIFCSKSKLTIRAPTSPDMHRSVSSLKNVQRTFSRSLSNAHRPLQAPHLLPLEGTSSLPRFTDIFDIPHRLGELRDSGAPRPAEIREIGKPFLIDLTSSDSLPPAILFDGPARRSKGRASPWTGIVGTPRRTLSEGPVSYESLIEVFDGPSHYNRRRHRPSRRERKVSFGYPMSDPVLISSRRIRGQ